MVLKSPLERTQAFSTPRKPTAEIPASNVEDALKYIKENASGGLTSVEDDPAPKLGGNLDLNGHQITGLAAVAASGSYNDLTGKPTLGTAASHDTGDFVPSAREVNGKSLSSNVTLSADDIGDGTTNKAFTATEKSKLSGIAAGAEVNVNADWNSNSGDSQILNKPTLGSAASHAASDFATAAQGALADSATQPGDLGTAAALDIDTDGTLAANSDTKVASQKAIKTALNGKASNTIDIVAIIGDGVNVIATGAAGNWIPALDFGGTIQSWSILGNESGSISIDLWKCTQSNFDAGSTHPVAADKISASAPITFSSAVKANSSTLTGWTTTFSANDILAFNVASVTSCKQIKIALKVAKA